MEYIFEYVNLIFLVIKYKNSRWTKFLLTRSKIHEITEGP